MGDAGSSGSNICLTTGVLLPPALSSLENPKFPGILARLEESPVCQRLPLASFLILPFQRITRLKMLVDLFSEWAPL